MLDGCFHLFYSEEHRSSNRNGREWTIFQSLTTILLPSRFSYSRELEGDKKEEVEL